jgi:hypothetical protein
MLKVGFYKKILYSILKQDTRHFKICKCLDFYFRTL